MARASNSTALRRLLLAAAAAGALAVASCGSDDGGGGSGAETLRVTETDFAIEPADARVENAGAVTISVVNEGKAPHALAIETPDGLVETDTLDAGQTGELEADLQAGAYTWFCPVGDHRARGMEGKLTVGSGGGDAEEPAGGSGY